MRPSNPWQISDTSSCGSGWSRFWHVTALNAIVWVRHGFGRSFIGPFWMFVTYWLFSVALSVGIAMLTHSVSALGMKAATLALYLAHFVSALVNQWRHAMSRPVRHDKIRNENYCGTSWLAHFFSKSENSVLIIFILEPVIVLLVAGLLSLVDLGLGLTLLLSAVVLMMKNYSSYDRYARDLIRAQAGLDADISRIQEIVADVGASPRPMPPNSIGAVVDQPLPRNGLHQTNSSEQAVERQPSRQEIRRALLPSSASRRPALRVQVSDFLGRSAQRFRNFVSKCGRALHSRPPQGRQKVSAASNPAQRKQIERNARERARLMELNQARQREEARARLTRPPSGNHATASANPESLHLMTDAQVLDMPAGGFRNLDQLKSHRRAAISKYHPDRNADPGANAMSQRVEEAYENFRGLFEPR